MPDESPATEATEAAAAAAEEQGVDLSRVEGSGAGGRVLKADVDAAAEATPESEDASEESATEASALYAAVGTLASGGLFTFSNSVPHVADKQALRDALDSVNKEAKAVLG